LLAKEKKARNPTSVHMVGLVMFAVDGGGSAILLTDGKGVRGRRRAGEWCHAGRFRASEPPRASKPRGVNATSLAGLLEQEMQRHPALDASLERPHARDTAASEPKRLTGAGGFVGSGAAEHHVPIAGNVGHVRVELFAGDPAAPGMA
jgi:hypothetical protein